MLADFFNCPSAIKHEGKEYQLRKPTLVEQGLFERWLKQRGYDAIERRTYQSPEQQERDRHNLTLAEAAGDFEWGSELAVRTLRTRSGIGKLLSIILAEHGVTEELGGEIWDAQAREVAATLISKVTTDPKATAAACVSLGLPPDYLSGNSSSPSPTHPSTTGSTTSEPSPTTS